jgi:hypothetical protein
VKDPHHRIALARQEAADWCRTFWRTTVLVGLFFTALLSTLSYLGAPVSWIVVAAFGCSVIFVAGAAGMCMRYLANSLGYLELTLNAARNDV